MTGNACDSGLRTGNARVYEPPTDEQLVNFACVMAFGVGYSTWDRKMMEATHRVPEIRDEWLARHRQMQEAAWELPS